MGSTSLLGEKPEDWKTRRPEDRRPEEFPPNADSRIAQRPRNETQIEIPRSESRQTRKETTNYGNAPPGKQKQRDGAKI